MAGPTSVPVTVEENMACAALRLFSTCPASPGHVVPIMGPGATVGPVGTRVPMDLSSVSLGGLVDEILLSTRRTAPGETARKESSRER